MEDLEQIRELNLQREIYRLRKEGLNWRDIAFEVSEEFNKKISHKKVQELYEGYLARNEVILSSRREELEEAKEVANESEKEMIKLINEIRAKAKDHLELSDELLMGQYNNNEVRAYFKNLPVAIRLWKGILEQIETISKRQERVKANKNDYTLDEFQIMQMVNRAYDQKIKETGLRMHPGTQEWISIEE